MSDGKKIAEALGPFTSCDVADALVKLGVVRGGYLPGISLFSPQYLDHSVKITGPAYTVQYGLITDSVPALKSDLHYVDKATEGSVIFVSCPPGMVNAAWGGLNTRRAQIIGAAGTVVDGRCRDLAELRDFGYPVFASGVGATPPMSVAHITGTDVPIKVAQGDETQIINPGDFLIGDMNGVACLPKDQVWEAIEVMTAMAEDEKVVMAALEKGLSMTQALKLKKRK